MKPVELVPRTFHPQLEQTSHTSVTPPPNFDPRVMQNYLADCRSEQFDQRRFVHSNLTDYDRLPHNNLDDSYTSEHNNNDLMGRIDSDSENLIEIEYESQPPVPPTSFRSQPQNLLQEVHSASNVGLLIDIDDNNQLSTPTHSAGTAVAISQSTDVNAIGSCPPCLPKADQSQTPTPPTSVVAPNSASRPVSSALPPEAKKFLVAQSHLPAGGQLNPLVPIELFGDSRIELGMARASQSVSVSPYQVTYLTRDEVTATDNPEISSNSSGPSTSVSRQLGNEDLSPFVKIGRLPMTGVRTVQDLKLVLARYSWFEGIETVELISPIVPEDRGFYSARVGFQTCVDAEWAILDLNNKTSLFKGQIVPLTATSL